MLLQKPHPFYSLLEETEIAAGTTSAVRAGLSIDLKGYLFIIRRDTNAALTENSEDVFFYKHIIIVQ